MAEEKSDKKEENVVVEVSAKENNSAAGSDIITIKKDTLWKYSTFILLAIIIVGGFVWYNEDKNSPGVPTGQVINEPDAGRQGDSKVQVKIDGYPVKGKSDAKVTIVEYSDYQCPFCGRFYSETLPQIIKEYVDTGKAKLVLKDFPLSFHQFAQKAAEAAHCAREQKGDDGYWAMHDKIFSNQESLSLENINAWARELSLNGAKFTDCLGSGKMAGIVQKGFKEGQEDGIQGTPACLINGNLLSGAQPFSAFKSIIDAEL